MKTTEQILDDLRELPESKQRLLAAAVLQEGRLEAFVEEMEDHLDSEKTTTEDESPEPFPEN